MSIEHSHPAHNRPAYLSRNLEWVVIVAATLVGALLRFYQLGEQSLWDGEIFTLLFTEFDWNIFLQSVSTFSAHPPLWFALSKLAVAGGWNEMILRMPAVFAGIFSVPALYALGKRLFDARVGLLAAILLAFSPLDVIFSQNARNYAFFVLLTTLLIYAAVRATSDTGKKANAVWWVLFVVTALAGIYTHYLFVLPLAGTGLAVVVKLITDAMRQVGDRRAVGKWLRLALVNGRWFLVALIAIAGLYLPWTPTVGSAFLNRQLSREAANEETESPLSLETIPRLLKDFSGEPTWGLVLFAALMVIGIVWAWQAGKHLPRNRAALFWFGIAILLPILVTILLAPRRLPSKYLIYVLPAYLIFVANGIVGVSELARLTFLKSERRAAFLGLGILLLLLIAVTPNMPYWNGTRTIFTGEGWSVVDEWKPWRAVAARLQAQAQPGDIVLFPNEARALTARSVIPYFKEGFLEKLYSAPPTGRAWWVSEPADIPATNAPLVRAQEDFGNVVLQELAATGTFEQVAIPNASFEQGTKGWNISHDAVEWVADAGAGIDGQSALRLTARAPSYTVIKSEAFPVTPGKLYRVTAYVQDPTIGFYTLSPQLFVNFSEASNAPPRRTRLAPLVSTDKPGWMMLVADGLVPEGADQAWVEFGIREYASEFNPTSWLDEVRGWAER